MSPIAPPRTADDAFAGAIAALDGALQRLAEAAVIIGHGIWRGDGGQPLGRRLQLRRPLVGRHLLIAIAHPADGVPPHAPPCRPAGGETVLRLFDSGCTAACPAAYDTPAAFVAMRLARTLAAAAGERHDHVQRIILHAPPCTRTIASAPASLSDTLFA